MSINPQRALPETTTVSFDQARIETSTATNERGTIESPVVVKRSAQPRVSTASAMEKERYQGRQLGSPTMNSNTSGPRSTHL